MTSPYQAIPKRARLRDVTLRDGLQSVQHILPTTVKIALYEALTSAGVSELQVTSFVSPRRVPQLQDAEEVWKGVATRNERRSVLVANMAGFERAIRVGAVEIEAVLALSNTYNMKNSRRTYGDSLDEILQMTACSVNGRPKLTVALANSYHCFFEGITPTDRLVDIVGRLREAGVGDFMLCDTTGVATPDQVFNLSLKMRTAYPDVVFGAHLHETRGRGMANAMAAACAGIVWFDASVGGLGGSPFTPGVGGNLSLEALSDALESMQIATAIDPHGLRAAVEILAAQGESLEV